MKEQIKDREHLLRDSSSRAIINTNTSALIDAKLAKERRVSQIDRLDRLEEKMDTLLEMLSNK